MLLHPPVWGFITALLVCFCFVQTHCEEDFQEHLTLIPVTDHVISYFDFTFEKTYWPFPTRLRQYKVFPLSIAKLFLTFNLTDLHVSLTRGRWRPSWGNRLLPSPQGAEVWACFSAEKVCHIFLFSCSFVVERVSSFIPVVPSFAFYFGAFGCFPKSHYVRHNNNSVKLFFQVRQFLCCEKSALRSFVARKSLHRELNSLAKATSLSHGLNTLCSCPTHCRVVSQSFYVQRGFSTHPSKPFI